MHEYTHMMMHQHNQREMEARREHARLETLAKAARRSQPAQTTTAKQPSADPCPTCGQQVLRPQTSGT